MVVLIRQMAGRRDRVYTSVGDGAYWTSRPSREHPHARASSSDPKQQPHGRPRQPSAPYHPPPLTSVGDPGRAPGGATSGESQTDATGPS